MTPDRTPLVSAEERAKAAWDAAFHDRRYLTRRRDAVVVEYIAQAIREAETETRKRVEEDVHACVNKARRELEGQVAVLRDALEEIADPISRRQRRLKEGEHILDDAAALSRITSTAYRIGVARAALSADAVDALDTADTAGAEEEAGADAKGVSGEG